VTQCSNASPTARPARLGMPAQQQKTFSSPEQAAHALYDAARNHDENALVAILGPGVIWRRGRIRRPRLG